MLKRPKKSAKNTKPATTRLQRLSLFFFNRPRRTALIWLVIVLFGATCYGTLLKREGFPSINTPFAIAQGSYLVHNPAKVDSDVAKPLSDFLLKQKDIKTVQAQSFGDFYSVIVNYKDNVKDAGAASRSLSKQVTAQHFLPSQATFKLTPFEFGFTERGDDLVVSFYSKHNTADTENLVARGKQVAAFIQSRHLPLVKDVSVINPYETATNPLTGAQELNQKSFDRFGEREASANNFYTSVVVGVKAHDGADNLELDDQVQSAVTALNKQPEFRDYHAVISASFAPQIKEQITELQTTLLEGLAAVLIIGSLVIAARASIITVVSMVTVLAAVNGLLYLLGYSLNTITLFALILGLSLIVDDTIIMVEAIDSQRRKQKEPGQAVSQATRKVSRAMIAATSTSVLSFAPLLFVGGILGSFIRAIPITIIASLLISLTVALIFIPLFARFLLLGKKQMGARHDEIAASVEARIARFISGPMLWAKGSAKKLFTVGILALVIGFGFIGAGGYLFQKVTFNIFPHSKDSNQLSAVITYHPDTDINQAQTIASQVDDIIGKTTGSNFVKASYFGQANIQMATLTIDITDYKSRDITAPDIIKQLNNQFDHFQAAEVEAAQLDTGPPAAAFTVQIASEKNRPAALKLAQDVSTYLGKDARLKRPDGTIAKLKSVSIGNSSIYNRKDGKQFVDVNAKFVDDDTTTLVTLAQDAVKKEFPPDKVASYSLDKHAISFDTGQEQENQDSFKTLALAFPALLLVIYIVLAFQFRSLLQPLLIFMAIPFSLFGITLGLYLTNNAFSFFAMLGFFALIGLSIKNTILLTDYANQSRQAGSHPVDAAHEALAERFRPLIATSLTAAVSLIPLAITSPFWEGLSVVLIFGLLSSTFLVITVFPYYYLGSEFLRRHINRRTGLGWLVLSAALGLVFAKTAPPAIILAPILSALIVKAVKRQNLLRKHH